MKIRIPITWAVVRFGSNNIFSYSSQCLAYHGCLLNVPLFLLLLSSLDTWRQHICLPLLFSLHSHWTEDQRVGVESRGWGGEEGAGKYSNQCFLKGWHWWVVKGFFSDSIWVIILQFKFKSVYLNDIFWFPSVWQVLLSSFLWSW